MPYKWVAITRTLINRSWEVFIEDLGVSNENLWINNWIGYSDEKQRKRETKNNFLDDYPNLTRKTLIEKIKSHEKHEKALLKHIDYLHKMYRKKLCRRNQSPIKSIV